MNLKKSVPLIVIGALLVAGLIAWQVSTATPPTATSPVQASGSSAVLPVTSNPIVNTSTTVGLTIVGAAVQDNIDPITKAAINDRLQLTLKNTGPTNLTGFEAFYTMTDATTKTSESYYQKLDGIQLDPGKETTVYFDNQSGPGHYPENAFSLYRSSKDKIDFAIQISAPGVKIATATAIKDAGTGEKSD
ncbi:hypothetical protein [Cryobacterium zhongshanensis]|uniref:Uncharacterized protein n=1 Tax=Cryobacterium zhongshanensis TaxID=2928153 RepID=A0AA41UHA1_9MICO|nr:hypothetical protein [Cryobacterium zhongshanensis]MCI4660067.1 hypothetical protein [Cryobacterium zhongshanensis]